KAVRLKDAMNSLVAAVLLGITFTILSAAALAADAPSATPTASPPSLNVRDFGAKGDGRTKDTVAFQTALNACAHASGTVVVPSGVYVIGSIVIGSNTTLQLERGANLCGSA